MTLAVFTKRNGALHPVDDEGRELLAKIKEGREITADVKQPRNPRHHRLYWALVRFLQEHVEGFHGHDKEDISDMIKIGTGLCKKFIDTHTGQVFYRPKSIAWERMDQTEFNHFFDNAAVLITTRWMKGNTPEEIQAEILTMVDPMKGAA